MLHKTKTSLAKHLWVDRTTINRMMDRQEVAQLSNQRGGKYYVHILETIRELTK